MDQGQLLEAFRIYLADLQKRGGFELAPYDWEGAPESMDIAWISYFWRLRDFAMTLANEINQFGHSIRRIESWRDILGRYGEIDRLELLSEFIDPLTLMALNLPSAIRCRLIFMAAHLCHQANRVHPGWRDDLEDDGAISFKALRRCGKPWKASVSLVNALGRIDNEDHRTATRNYRNRFHHRHPPRFEIGVSSTLSRVATGPGRSGYAFGLATPLRLEELTPPLWEQHRACLAAFKSFQELVWEQIEAIQAETLRWEINLGSPRGD